MSLENDGFSFGAVSLPFQKRVMLLLLPSVIIFAYLILTAVFTIADDTEYIIFPASGATEIPLHNLIYHHSIITGYMPREDQDMICQCSGPLR